METSEYRTMFDAEERHFWFRASRRIIMSWVDRALDEAVPPAGVRVLDVGAGTGGVLSKLAERSEAWGAEFSAEGAAFIRSRDLRVVRAGLPQLPFRDGAFDVVVSLDVFEHVQDDLAAMAEVRRVLRPGGRLIATVPALQWLWSEHDEALHHHRRYHLRQFRQGLEAAGFSVRRLSYYNTLLLPPIAATRMWGRLRGRLRRSRGQSTSDVSIPPAPLNHALTAIFGAEVHWLERFRLPLGASLIVDAQS